LGNATLFTKGERSDMKMGPYSVKFTVAMPFRNLRFTLANL
jgi:hypothetical protein